MIKKTGWLLLTIVLVLSVLSCSSPAPAAVPVVEKLNVIANSAVVDFPLNLNFKLQAKSKAEITDVRISYMVDQVRFANVISEAVLQLKPENSIDTTWTLDMKKVGGLPPGATVEYWWLVKDTAGDKIETPHGKVQFNDNRFSWKYLSEGKITIFWYEGDNAFAQALMKTAQQALVRLARDTGASPERTIKIYIYAGSKDLQQAMIFPQEWTGGVAFTEYGVIAIGITPSILTWGQGAMTHELTHQVISQVTFNPYNDLPTWLNEGLAMYNEGTLTAQYISPLANAVINKKLISVRSLSSPFSAYTEISLQSYAQSYSLVEYLVSQHGASKMTELLSNFKKGSGFDEALKKVYSFDMDGLDTLWRNYIAARLVPKK